MSSIKTTQMDGDVSVGRNVAVGGGTTIQGDAHIKGGVKVDGWLDAQNVKVSNKGLFTTIEKLRAAYPNPQDGWWAIVGNSLPSPIYTVDGGVWISTGEMGGNPTIESERYANSIVELEASMTTAKTDISGHAEKIKTIEEELVQISASSQLTRALEKPKLVENGEFQTATYGIQSVRPTIGQPCVASAGFSNNQRIYIAVNEGERISLKNTTETDSKFCWTIDAQTKISNNTKLNQPEGENSTYDVPNNSELEVVAPKGAKFICIQSKNDGVACMPEVYKFVSRLDANEEIEKQLSAKVEAFEGRLSEEKAQRAEANKALKREIFSEIGEVKNKLIPIPTKTYPYLMHQRKVWAGYSSAKHVYLPVEQGKTYLIKANSDYPTNYAFATEVVNAVNGQKVTGLSTIDGEVHEVEKASTIAVMPPADANYLIVNITDGSSFEKTWSIAPIVEEKLTLVEALNSGENTLDIVALNGENEINNKLLQLRRHLNMNISGTSGLMPVVLLWFSDIHSDKVQFKRIMKFYERYKTYMNGVLCTGDMVFDSLRDDYSYLENDLKKLMMTLGNHDIARTAWNDQTVTAEEDYNIFIKPFAEAGLVDNFTLNKCYWYKDYPSQKLRLVGLDALHWDSEQNKWLEASLNDAKNKGYSVVCANHFFGGRNRTHIECAFDNVQKLSEGDAFINAEAPATIQKFIDSK